jgi:hypothetical protein
MYIMTCTKTTLLACFFLGYSSGHVQVVKAMQEGDRYSYEVISTAHVHTDEVTVVTQEYNESWLVTSVINTDTCDCVHPWSAPW